MTKSASTDGFSDPVKSSRLTTGSVGPVNGINKDVSGARLLPTQQLFWFTVSCELSLFLSLTKDTVLLSVS